MFGRVDLAFLTEYGLCPRDLVGVDKAVSVVGEARPEPGRTGERERYAARSAVEVQCKARPPGADLSGLWLQDSHDVRIAFEDRMEPVLDHHRDAQVGPVRLE